MREMVGAYREARLYLERTLEITERMLGEEHSETATSLNNLAILLKNQGDYERALEIQEKVLGEEHPDTATSLNNLANLLSDQGDYEGAKSLYERALEIREKILGEEHPYTSRLVRENLADLES